MVSNITPSTKKCPPNIRTTSVHSPVLVSPISVAQRNKMLETEGVKQGNNWMRDQWVANLKKKRMAGNNNNNSNSSSSGGSSPSTCVVKVGSLDGRHNSTLEKNINAHARNQHRHSQRATISTPLASSNQLHMMDKDDLSLSNPALFFNDLGCFEIESQCFTQLTPSSHDYEVNRSNNTVTLSSSSGTSGPNNQKRYIKPLLKKRTNCLELDVNQPKPRTPRRKLNCGTALFDDCDSVSSSPRSYSSVGTPSNFNAEVSRMWGPEFDFGTNGYVDTFLDLPTPKSAEMPLLSGSYHIGSTNNNNISAHTTASHSSNQSSSDTIHTNSTNESMRNDKDLGFPRLVRTNSIEQEGLSQFLEQTNLNGDHHDEPALSYDLQRGSNNNDTISSPHGLKSYNSSNRFEWGIASPSNSAYNAAVVNVVDECFSKLMPSPVNARFLATPRGAKLGRTNQHSSNSDCNVDHKGMPEFETLLDEYKFTDIDQELDSFYLDTIESFGGELDLLAN